MEEAVQNPDVLRPVSAHNGRGHGRSISSKGSSLSNSLSAPQLSSDLSDLERCRGIAALEVMRKHLIADAKRVLTQDEPPLSLGHPPMKGYVGMPPHIFRNCEKAMRTEAALNVMPEPMRRRFEAVPVEDWAGRDVWTRPGSAPTGTRPKPLLRNAPTKAAPQQRRLARPPSRAAVARDCFVYIEKLVKLMWHTAPQADLPLLVARVVHGDPPVVPMGPVGDEVRRVVPLPAALEAGERWEYMEETIATQAFAELYSPPAEAPRRAKTAEEEEEEARRHKSTSDLAEVVRKEQSRKLAAWRRQKGETQRVRTQRGSTPGPGAYCDRSLQRSVTDPRCGEFAPSGNSRTKCTFTTLSQTRRFPAFDRTTDRVPRPKPRKKVVEEKLQVEETLWQKLLGV